jgi:HlyD family secretion protein
MQPSSRVAAASLLGLALSLAGCARPHDGALQGYVEGEFVFVAAPTAGELQRLAVQRGSEVRAGDLLFALEDTAERAAVARASGLLEHARARLADERKGARPTELASLEAQVEQARAARDLSDIELRRLGPLVAPGAVSTTDLDRAEATHRRNVHHVAQLEADHETALLGAREDRIAAAEADVRLAEAELARATWDLAQRQQSATAAARVFDTPFREGEWVPASMPVAVLLPPTNIKVRAYVPEPRIGAIQVGDEVTLRIDGVTDAPRGTVAFVSPQAEYTPPVIFSRESREKLVFLIEVRFDPETAQRLHPGQPVDVLCEVVDGTR